MKFEEAKQYCQKLDPNGKWRLPTIDELRKVIKGCPATESKGECSLDSYDSKVCLCSAGSSYSKFSDKENNQLWSQTKTDSKWWIVDFDSGGILPNVEEMFGSPVYVRCVKKNNK